MKAIRWLNMHRLRLRIFFRIVWREWEGLVSWSTAWWIAKHVHDRPWNYKNGRPA
jgi:hypothetical protein